MRYDDYTDRIERFRALHNIKTYCFEHRGRHRRAVITHSGREITYIFPFSGSDRRGPHNAVSSLRHVLGLVGKGAS
jgi:hypothetical protein